MNVYFMQNFDFYEFSTAFQVSEFSYFFLFFVNGKRSKKIENEINMYNIQSERYMYIHKA